jgi:hypothetical protein
MAAAYPLVILGQDDWLIYARGTLVYTVIETDGHWLDAPHRGDCWNPDTGLNCDNETRFTCRRDCLFMLQHVSAHTRDYEWDECGHDPVSGEYLGWPASADADFTARSSAEYLPRT